MNKVIGITYKWYFPFIILVMYQLIIHIFAGNYHGDDIAYVQRVQQEGLFNVISNDVSSYGLNPVTLSFQLLFASMSYWIWRVIDIFVVFITAYMTMRLVFNEKNLEYSYFICVIWLFFPFTYLSSAGWVITTIGYLWAIPLMLYYLIISKEILINGCVKTYQLVLSYIFLLYLSSGVQLQLILGVLILLFIFYAYKKNIKKSFFYISLCIVVLNAIISALRTGPRMRYVADEVAFFQNFSMLTVPEKIQIGFMQVTTNMFLNANWINLILCIVVALSAYRLYEQKIIRLIAIFPLVIQLLFGFLYGIIADLYPTIRHIVPNTENYMNHMHIYNNIVNASNYFNLVSYIPLALMILSFVTLAIAILYTMKNKILSILASVAYILGIGSATMVGFAPSVYASSHRTQILAFLMMMLVAGIIVGQNKFLLDDIKYRAIRYILLIATVFYSFIQFIFIYNLYLLLTKV